VDEYTYEFENILLVKRPTDLAVGDPRLDWKLKTRYRDYLQKHPEVEPPYGTQTYVDDGIVVDSPLEPVKNPQEAVRKSDLWWDAGDDSGPNYFMTLPYLPFFSNCKGYDQVGDGGGAVSGPERGGLELTVGLRSMWGSPSCWRRTRTAR
jgi:hypothetical protein